MVMLANEFPADKWEITDARIKLFDILTDRLKKIEEFYKRKRYKDIRKIGYQIHNIPEMICKNEIFESNFAE